jgi:hypothetical protein
MQKQLIFLVAMALMATVHAQHVGINTDKPNRPLTIRGVGDNVELISLRDTNDSTYWHVNMFNKGFNIARSPQKDFAFFIDSIGRVGLGVGTPAFPFQVNQEDSNSVIAFFRNLKGSASIVTHNGSQYAGLGVDSTSGFVGSLYNPIDFRILAGSSEQVRIKHANGYVGVGTSAPSRKLEVQSTVPDIALFGSTTSIGIISIRNSSAELELGADALGGLLGTHTDTDLRFRTGNVAKMIIRHATGNVGIGTNNPTEKLHVIGKGFFTEGITLPNSGGVATAFDYYEELPIISNIFNGANVYQADYSYRVIRIGKQVTITLPKEVLNMSIGNVTEILLGGLPARFRPSGDVIRQAVQVLVNGNVSTGVLLLKADGNISLRPNINNASASWASPGNSGFYGCSFTYNLPL